ncbi:hypothetical protein PAL_GLEAN10013291 [Pteropus alecto]|uniref:Uncharacterized protein n=1 Tax=Pteropus alecto TaxID=9402 RepID=L5KGU3_PTEAL|nr:hypothetical protein PAL_GLEAN10013291 [Pteropus alecto]
MAGRSLPEGPASCGSDGDTLLRPGEPWTPIGRQEAEPSCVLAHPALVPTRRVRRSVARLLRAEIVSQPLLAPPPHSSPALGLPSVRGSPQRTPPSAPSGNTPTAPKQRAAETAACTKPSSRLDKAPSCPHEFTADTSKGQRSDCKGHTVRLAEIGWVRLSHVLIFMKKLTLAAAQTRRRYRRGDLATPLTAPVGLTCVFAL